MTTGSGSVLGDVCDCSDKSILSSKPISSSLPMVVVSVAAHDGCDSTCALPNKSSTRFSTAARTWVSSPSFVSLTSRSSTPCASSTTSAIAKDGASLLSRIWLRRFSKHQAKSPMVNCSTMRPLPFKVWKERRIANRVSWLVKSLRHANRFSRILTSSP